MKKYKVFLTMEFEADVQEENEAAARDLVARQINFSSEVCGCKEAGVYYAKNIRLKRYWGGGNLVKDGGCDDQ